MQSQIEESVNDALWRELSPQLTRRWPVWARANATRWCCGIPEQEHGRSGEVPGDWRKNTRKKRVVRAFGKIAGNFRETRREFDHGHPRRSDFRQFRSGGARERWPNP